MRNVQVLSYDEEAKSRYVLHGPSCIALNDNGIHQQSLYQDPTEPKTRGFGPKSLFILLCLVMGLAGAVYAFQPHQDIHTHATKTVTVQPGMTLWGIAQSVNTNDEQDTRILYTEIQQMNHMNDVTVYPGEKLEVPIEGR